MSVPAKKVIDHHGRLGGVVGDGDHRFDELSQRDGEAASDDLRRAVDAAVSGKRYLCAEVTNDMIESALEGDSRGNAHQQLASRELEVLQLLAEGFTSSEIAARLCIATSTVETHRRSIMRKLDLHSVAELTKYAVREGLTSLEATAVQRKR